MALTSLRFNNGLPVLPGLRAMAGGDLVIEGSSDPAKQALAEICLDCYPFTLLPERHDQFHFGMLELPHFYGSEKLNRFVAAVRNDTILMSLFPEGTDDDMAGSHQYFTSFRHGGGVQLVLLHQNLIQSGVALMHARNQSSTASLQLAVWEMLDALRGSLSGAAPKLPVFDLFDLVGLPNDFSFPMENSKLLGIPNNFVRHLPRDARPAQSWEGDMLGGILERQCEFKIAIMPSSFELGFQGNWPIEMTTNTDLELRNAVALSTSLATNTERTTAARWRATITIDPLRGVGQSWSTRSASLGSQHVLDTVECQNLTDRLTTISVSNLQQIEMAIGRFLSATTRRDDQQDSLVDAVIGLESLFGGRAEISLSVASGAANLLGKDAVERKSIFETAKKIYNARSALVHGSSKQVLKLDVPSLRISALDLLKRSILELLEARPDLLPLSGQERVKELVIA